MYSPKIAEELIPHLYRMAKGQGIPMTHLVTNILRKHIEEDCHEMHHPSTDREPDYRSAG